MTYLRRVSMRRVLWISIKDTASALTPSPFLFFFFSLHTRTSRSKRLHINLIYEFGIEVRVKLDPAQKLYHVTRVKSRFDVPRLLTFEILPSMISAEREEPFDPSWRTFFFRFTLHVSSSTSFFPLIFFQMRFEAISRTIIRHFSSTTVVLHHTTRFSFNSLGCHWNHDAIFHSYSHSSSLLLAPSNRFYHNNLMKLTFPFFDPPPIGISLNKIK